MGREGDILPSVVGRAAFAMIVDLRAGKGGRRGAADGGGASMCVYGTYAFGACSGKIVNRGKTYTSVGTSAKYKLAAQCPSRTQLLREDRAGQPPIGCMGWTYGSCASYGQ